MALLGNMHSMSTDVIAWDDVPEWTGMREELCDQYLDRTIFSGRDAEASCQEPVNDIYNLGQHDTYWSNAVEALKQSTAHTVYTPSEARMTESHPDFLSLGGNPSPPASVSPSSTSYAPFNHGDNVNASYPVAAHTYSIPRGGAFGKNQWADTTSFTHNSAWTLATSSTQSADSYVQDSWQKLFGPDAQQSEHSSSSSQTCRTASSSPDWLSQDFCGTSSVGLLDSEFVTTGNELPCSSKHPTAAEYDSYLWPLAQSFQQTHLHSPSDYSWSGTVLDSKDACNTIPSSSFSQSSDCIHFDDTASLDVPSRTLKNIIATYQSTDHAVNSGHHDQGSSASGFTRQSCSAPLFDSVDLSTIDGLLGIDNSVFETTEEHDPIYSIYGIDSLGVEPRKSSHWPTTTPRWSTSQTARSCQLATPGNAVQSLATSSYPQVQPLYRRLNPDTGCGHDELTKPRSASPISPSITVTARRTCSSRRSIPNRRPHRHARREKMSARGGFVNYTPQDHNKILSGVAPSGSFKTKARRDREMEMRRQQISQAAVRAVVEAGGDLERLRDEGLLV